MDQMLWVVRDGSAEMGIVCDSKEPAALFARDELRLWIGRKTGCTLPDGVIHGKTIRLNVDSTLKQIGDESYRISKDERGVLLTGATASAIVHAAMDFLELEVGITFAGLDHAGVNTGCTRDLTVTVQNRQKQPALSVRGMMAGRHEDSSDWLGLPSRIHTLQFDWMARNKMNLVVLDPPTWNYDNRDPMSDRRNWDNVAALAHEVHRRGMKVHWGHHAWNTWLPPYRYFEKHPEYYAMRDGERVVTDAQMSLCTSNPNVADAMAAEMLSVCDQYGADWLSIWPEDGTGMCECDDCRALTDLPDGLSVDRVLGTNDEIPISKHNIRKTYIYARFVNEVARRIAKEAGDVKLSALFYHDIDAPPVAIDLEPNVVPVVALYWRCSRHTLNTPDCENVYYQRILEQWSERYPGRVVIYDYPMGMAAYADLPWPIGCTWQDDWRTWKDMGVAGGMLQTSTSSFTVYGANYMRFAKMGWDIDANYETAVLPYFTGLYGEAAAPIAKMFKLLEDRMAHVSLPYEQRRVVDEILFHGHPSYDRHYRECVYPTPDAFACFVDERVFVEMKKCLQQARELAENSRVIDNLRKLATALEYWELVYEYQMLIADARRLWLEKASADRVCNVLDRCLLHCQDAVDLYDRIGDRDVLNRCLGFRLMWTRQVRQLRTWRKTPGSPPPHGIKKWP